MWIPANKDTARTLEVNIGPVRQPEAGEGPDRIPKTRADGAEQPEERRAKGAIARTGIPTQNGLQEYKSRTRLERTHNS